MKKLDSVTRPSESYLSPAVKTVILGCEGVLCNSKFGGNGIEDMDAETELLPGGFKFI